MEPNPITHPTRRRKRTRPTITQVAAEAGVAVATVSGILNQRRDCRSSAATRERVLKVVHRLGYRPSYMAHALHGKATKTLGLVVPGIGVHEIINRTIGAFHLAARRHGYMTVTATTENHPSLEDEAIKEMLDRHVDALAIHPTESGAHTELRALVAEGVPVVTFDGAGRLDFSADDVSIDQFHGGRLQGRHLVEIGRRRVCVLNTVQTCYVNDQKIAGLRQALLEAGCGEPTLMNISLPMHTLGRWDAGEFEQVRDFLQRRIAEFDALTSVSDVRALVAIRIATELGVRVPEQLAVVGFNDITLAEQVVPSLTTVRDPVEQMGEVAFQLLTERLEDRRDNDQPRKVKLLPEMRVRESTVGPRTASADAAARSRHLLPEEFAI